MSVLKEMNLSSEQFRVVVFGSARIKPEDNLYKEVYKIGYKVVVNVGSLENAMKVK